MVVERELKRTLRSFLLQEEACPREEEKTEKRERQLVTMSLNEQLPSKNCGVTKTSNISDSSCCGGCGTRGNTPPFAGKSTNF